MSNINIRVSEKGSAIVRVDDLIYAHHPSQGVTDLIGYVVESPDWGPQFDDAGVATLGPSVLRLVADLIER